MKANYSSSGSSLVVDSKYASLAPTGLVATPAASKVSGTQTAQAKEVAHGPREMAYRIASRLMLGDLLTCFASILIGGQTFLYVSTGGIFTSLRAASEGLAWSAAGALVFAALLASLRTYEQKNLYRMNYLLKNVAKATFLWAVIVLAAAGLVHQEGYGPQWSVAYSMVALVLGMVVWRMGALAWLLKPSVRTAACSRVVVIGWNEKSAHLRDAMHRDLSELAEIVGCVPTPGGRFTQKPPEDVAVLGDYSELPNLIRANRVDQVILSDVSCPVGEIQHLIAFCQREYVSFQMIPEYFPALNSGLQVQTVSGVPLLGVGRLPLDKTLNRAVKRGIDIVGAIVGLAISSLIIPWFCLIVYLESPGPVIYRQKRTSRGGRGFFIYKIRSMRLNAESGSGAVWCKKEDPRRLRIGTFMRKTNIDELPQFWNVLKGDMSLVGPRPERPELIEKFKHEIPNYNVRHKARAGLTGWAAINGWRGDTDLGKRVEADLYYLENWSVFLDLYCIFATCFKIKNAH